MRPASRASGSSSHRGHPSSSSFGAPICGRPGASIAQYDPWIKPQRRSAEPERSVLVYARDEPRRLGERLSAAGAQSSRSVCANELFSSLTPSKVDRSERRVSELAGTWHSHLERTYSYSRASPDSPEAEASVVAWPHVAGYTPGSDDVARSTSLPVMRTGSFSPSRVPARRWLAGSRPGTAATQESSSADSSRPPSAAIEASVQQMEPAAAEPAGGTVASPGKAELRLRKRASKERLGSAERQWRPLDKRGGGRPAPERRPTPGKASLHRPRTSSTSTGTPELGSWSDKSLREQARQRNKEWRNQKMDRRDKDRRAKIRLWQDEQDGEKRQVTLTLDPVLAVAQQMLADVEAEEAVKEAAKEAVAQEERQAISRLLSASTWED